jgi:hypothetical protein
MSISTTKQLIILRTIIIGGLAVGALGISFLWASGVVFPVYPPPGIVLLLAGALFITFVSKRWAYFVGLILSLFIVIGFLVSPAGRSNLAGDAGLNVAIGQGIQLTGVVIALVASSLAVGASYRKAKQ